VSLRTRLVAGLVALLALGLVAGNVVTYRALRSFLHNRVDEQLVAARQPAIEVLGRPAARGPRARAEVVGATFAELRSRDGSSIRYVTRGVAEPAVEEVDEPGFHTVRSDGGPSYRLLVTEGPNGAVLVVGQSLADVAFTLRRLLAIEVVATSVVLGLIAALAHWLVRSGLRPLEDMTATAGVIAAGDLSQRVPEPGDGSEVGQLATAFNTMLGHIEDAFAEKEASEQRLRRFVADASHELRTPLTSIRGYAELFRRGASDRPEDLATAMRRIEEEGARMGGLVDDMLLLARLDQHRPLERAEVDLGQVVEDGATDLRAADPGRPVEVAVTGPVIVLGDEARLRQVVANLLGNAREHTPPGTPVTVSVGAQEGWARLEVEDQGPGVPADRAGRVFERFFRADDARSRGTGGAGLGLSIVAAIAEAHGGRASVVPPEPDQDPPGFTVRVELPLAHRRAEAPAPLH
jgi:two-component system, OmpR family, sensor kinase